MLIGPKRYRRPNKLQHMSFSKLNLLVRMLAFCLGSTSESLSGGFLTDLVSNMKAS